MISLGPICEGTFKKRPSAKCKTPYVSDVTICSNDAEGAASAHSIDILAHSPSLGCSGLIDKGTSAKMILTSMDDYKQKKQVCSHKIQLVKLPHKGGVAEQPEHTLICVNPKLSEQLVELCFINNVFPSHLDFLNNVKSLKAEQSSTDVSFGSGDAEPSAQITKSRFDFFGKTKTNKNFILEVKSVPLIDPETNEAVFPDGPQKKKGAVISPRALKHINHLREICESKWDGYTILAFCVQRGDACGFKLSEKDPTYKNAVNMAKESGVIIIVLYFNWILVNSEAHCDLENIQIY